MGLTSIPGDTPAFIHMHMFITDEMADLREQILKQAILDEGLSSSIANRWLKVDESFRPGIVKKSIDRIMEDTCTFESVREDFENWYATGRK